jgi:M6 family metalloprotease-like protein
MVEDAVRTADAVVDFAPFDNDGPDNTPRSCDDDGLIDALVVVHAGNDAALGDTREMLSHNWTTTAVVPTHEHVGAWRYAVVAQTSPLGTCAHEFGHQLGLPDLYQSGSIAGLGGGLGDWSLMASGAWLGGTFRDGTSPADLDAASKIDLGFVDAIEPQANATALPLRAARGTTPGDVYRVWTHGRPDLETFVIENRQPRGLDAALPGGGMLVYHVDRSAWNNDDAEHPRVALLQADGREDIERRINNGDALDPFPGTRGVLDATTDPHTRARDGSDTQIRLAAISAPTPTMTFDLRLETTPLVEVLSQQVRAASGGGVPMAGEPLTLSLLLHNAGMDAGPLALRAHAAIAGEATWSTDTAALPGLAKGDSARVEFELVPRSGLGDPYGLELVVGFATSSWNDSTLRVVGLGAQTGFQACLQAVPSRCTRDCSDPAQPWTVEVLKGAGAWSLEMHPGDLASVYRSARGPRYGNGVEVALESPSFQLASGSVLQLLHAMDAQAAPGGWAYDGGLVELSLDGAAWEALAPRVAGQRRLLPPSVPALGGSLVFSAQSPRHWDQFDLGTRSGSARVRFRFVSGDSVAGAGWEIARVEVVSGARPDPKGLVLELAVEPNPVRLPARIAFGITASLTAAPRPTTLGIYDPRGRLVRVLTHAAAPASAGVFVWDGTDGSGHNVASGMYFARLDWGGARAATKVLVLR